MDQYQTSEKVKINYEIASVPLRIAAYCVDLAFQGITFFAVYIIMFVFFSGGMVLSTFTNKIVSYVLMIIGLLLLLLAVLFIIFYRLFFEIIWKGQTPGKKFLKIRVINDDGTYLKVIPAILRNLFRIVDMLPIYNITGLITMLINKNNKRIGDIVAGTIVIKEHQIVLPDTIEDIKLDCFSDINDINNKFSDSEKEIFNSYYYSKKELSSMARENIQNKLIELIERKTQITRPTGVSKENFIHALCRLLK